MTKSKQPEGKCLFCGEVMTRRKLFNHLKPNKCEKRLKAVEKSEKSKRSPQRLFHLRAKPSYGLEFWLDLEVRESAFLKELDHYLRAIWLECCGHLSEFFSNDFFAGEISMEVEIGEIFDYVKKIYHTYDFGTTSETIIELISVREGKPLTANSLFLMARNEMAKEQCLECKKIATHLCTQCMYENEKGCIYCDEHTEKHLCDDYGELIEIVNSPRLGACGYDGPAEPPY
jgi:hypothetical protein